MSYALTLHHHALNPHSAHLQALLLSLTALTPPPPTTYPGPHTLKLRALAYDIFLTLSTTATTLSTISHCAHESYTDILHPPHHNFRHTLSHRASRSIAHLKDIIRSFNHLITQAKALNPVVSRVQQKHSQAKVRYAKQLLDTEDFCIKQRTTWCHAERRVREMDGLIRHARRQEREARARVWLARCTNVIMMPARMFGGDGGAHAVGNAVRGKWRKSCIVDRVASDRVGVIEQRAVEARVLLDGAVRLRRSQELLQEADACVERAVGDYAALKGVEVALGGVAGVVEGVVDLFGGMEGGEVEGGDLESWHTVKVALGFFAWEQTEMCRELSGALEKL